ncbi:T9SS C-terminal target domain-containing protein [Marinilabiliaceae bacterium JC017]|nr:T9SS C-terminal target domain-containing protein [Marinilabiliaceae bacterium JC017]
MKFLTSISLLCISLAAYAHTLTISVEKGKFQIDHSLKLILSQIDNMEHYADLTNYEDVHIILGDNEYRFINPPEKIEYSNSYIIDLNNEQYTLYFTQLPIITINTENAIVNEPKVLANFTYTDEDQSCSSMIGIELRGGSSQGYPKKTYDLEFWEDEIGEESRSVQFGALRKDDDWILDALYNEPLRIRSFISHKLWLKIHQPHYLNEEPKAKSGADVMYAELFLNQKYNGVYLLSEQVDKKQLKIKSYKGSIRGELYKGVSWGASTFSRLQDFDNNVRTWSGYEMKYPDEDQITDWTNLYNFTDFVLNATDSEFESDIWNRFNKGNCMDYFIFLNLLRATDNTGKNIYLAKCNVKGEYFYVPWDLDGSWGTIWNGTNDATTDDILLNGFFKRVLEQKSMDYSQSLKNSWIAYRKERLAQDELEKMISGAYNYLQSNNVYDREKRVYPNYLFDEDSKEYMTTWLDDRLSFLDSYYSSLVSTDLINPTVSGNAVYPNPTTNYISIKQAQEVIDEPYSIFTLNGEIVKRGRISATNNINISDLPAGFYFIKIDAQTYKFIVK